MEVLEILMIKMIRPIIYKVIARMLVGLTLALLWDKFFNAGKTLSMPKNAFFAMGIIYFALAWVTYLKMDGLRFHFLNENKERKNRHRLKFMITDFSNEEPVPFDSSDENNESHINLYSNILAGVLFLLPSVFSMLFFI